MSIQKNLEFLKSQLSEGIDLVAVSKTKPIEDILKAYEVGHRIFGENKIQEMTQKQELLPKDIQWHMIGHVQRNKVKYMASYVSLIHGVDSLKLLREINKQALKNKRVIDCLLQVHIAQESSKFGFDTNEINTVFDELKENPLSNIRVVGLMGMASFTVNKDQVKEEFLSLKNIYDVHQNSQKLSILSMGMSGDYELAIACGSNMIRVGSRIFGERNTPPL
jgi:pyridoxal phosphate enzyme (YggS family)